MPNHHEGQLLNQPFDAEDVERTRHNPALGITIKQLRKANGLTLNQLSERTGLSNGFISQIEHGRNRPSITALFRISRALGVSVGWFFPKSKDQEDQRSPITRAHERREISYEDGITDALLTPDLGGKLELLSCRFEPGSGVDTVYAHHGEEAGIIIKGTLDLWVDGSKYTLDTGDSFAFDSAKPHRYRNNGPVETIVIWALTPPGF